MKYQTIHERAKETRARNRKLNLATLNCSLGVFSIAGAIIDNQPPIVIFLVSLWTAGAAGVGGYLLARINLSNR